MSDLVARLRLEANASQLVAEAGRGEKAVKDLGAAGPVAQRGLDQVATADRNLTREANAASVANDRLGRELDGVARAAPAAARGLDQAARESRQLETSARGASGAGTALGLVMGGLGAREIIGGIKDAALGVAGLETGFGAVAGGAAGARSEMGFVAQEADRLGLNAKTSAESLLSLSAATNGTVLQGAATRNVWLGLNEAGVALNLTNERQVLAMQALSQMASKQVISQEELRGQLAEALPGAYQVAQRAMGLTSQEFNKLVASGNLLAEDFLPKFAAQLRKEFGPSVEQSLITPLGKARVEIAQTQNSLFGLQTVAGGAFLDGVTQGLASLNDELKDPEARVAAADLGRTIGEGLGLAAQTIGVLVDNIDTVGVALTALTVIGVSRWLVTMTSDLRGSAAAFIAKGQAAAVASAQLQSGAAGEARAVTTLRGAVEASARAQLAAAQADRDGAVARELLAQATRDQSRAQLVLMNQTLASTERQAAAVLAERELAIAKTATAAASARVEVAQVGLARASTLMGGAMGVARGAAAGLLGLLGGPWGLALMAAGAAVAFVSHELGENEKRAREAHAAQRGYASAMDEASKILAEAGMNTRAWSGDTKGAIGPTDALTTSTRLLTDQTIKLADARRQAALTALQASEQTLRDELKTLAGKSDRSTVKVVTGEKTDGSPIFGEMLVAARRDQAKNELAAAMAASIKLIVAPPAKEEKPKPTATTVRPDKADRQELGALIKAADWADTLAAQEAYRQALIAGGAALDDWKVKEAGRQAVERLALADRPKLTAAEQALVAQIRDRAEATEQLKLANQRIEAAIGLRKTMDADSAALLRRADATAKGERALEDLQVQEAGLQVLQRLGVDSLAQLTGAALDEAKAAIASAEARERQALATEKADRVAQGLASMDERIADERAHTLALDGGTKAQVDYARAEFVRQEIERAGKTLTAEQIALIRDKAEALFAIQAITQASSADADAREELRLSQMTNRERELEVRLKDRARSLQAQKKDLTEEEATAQARLLTLQAMEAEERARAIGTIKENLERTWVDSGKLGLDELGDYTERTLRQALWNAWLAEPIDIIVNAVVGSVSGLATQTLGLAGGAGGLGGLASLFNSTGALAGLTTGVTKALTSGLSSLGVGAANATKFGALGGTALGGAGTGMLVSSLAGMLGLKQTSGNQIGGAIGGAIGSFIPIPGGTLIGSALGNLVGGVLGGKKSNEAAVLSLDQTGQVTSIGGAKRTEETTAAAKSIAQAVAQVQAALVAGGATLGATLATIDIGHRDATHLNFSDGTAQDTAVGDVGAAIEAATRTIVAGAKWASEAQTAYAQKMLAAGATLDQVIGTLSAAGGFAKSVDDAIAKLVDPAAFEKKSALDAIEANYQALKTQAQELVGAGLVTGDVLGKLEQLRDLEVADALKRLGDAAEAAAVKLTLADAQALGKSVGDAIAQLKSPVEFERAQALGAIQASYEAMRTQAQELVASGLIGGDILAQLDELKSLQVAASIAKLGDAASDAATLLTAAAAKAQGAQDFSGSIDSAIAQLLDPTAFERQAALDAINAGYGAMRDQAQALVSAGLLGGEVLTKLDELRGLQVADAIKRLGDAASDAAARLAADAQKSQDAQSFEAGINDAIGRLLDPTAFERQAALDAINAGYDAMRDQAEGLVSVGLLSGDVLAKLDQLRGLQVADSIKRLGDAASDTAARLKQEADEIAARSVQVTDFRLSIGDAIQSRTDPGAAKLVKVERDYQARLAQAQSLLSGTALAQMVGQIDTLRSLELDEVMASLATAVVETVDVFAQARPRLQQWLDRAFIGSASPLNPMEQRGAAMASYERGLERARSGDSDALSNITSLADQLRAADREATFNAADRLGLFSKINADIGGLASMGGAVGRDPVVTAVMTLGEDIADPLKDIADHTDPEKLALAEPSPVAVANFSILNDLYRKSLDIQSRDLTIVLERLRNDLGARTDAMRSGVVTAIADQSNRLGTGLNVLGEQIASQSGGAQNLANQVGDLVNQIALLMAINTKQSTMQ